MQFGNWLLSPKTIRVVKGGFVLALLGAAWALFTEFTQLRGFVNLIASRIDLAFLWMCLFGVIWIYNDRRNRKGPDGNQDCARGGSRIDNVWS